MGKWYHINAKFKFWEDIMIKTPYCGDQNSPEIIKYSDFSNKAEIYVSKMLKDFIPASYREIKVIHDPVWGTMKFYPWELQVFSSFAATS